MKKPEIKIGSSPQISVVLDRQLDRLLDDESEDSQYCICEILCDLGLASRHEVDDGAIVYQRIYISTDELQELMDNKGLLD